MRAQGAGCILGARALPQRALGRLQAPADARPQTLNPERVAMRTGPGQYSDMAHCKTLRARPVQHSDMAQPTTRWACTEPPKMYPQPHAPLAPVLQRRRMQRPSRA